MLTALVFYSCCTIYSLLWSIHSGIQISSSQNIEFKLNKISIPSIIRSNSDSDSNINSNSIHESSSLTVNGFRISNEFYSSAIVDILLFNLCFNALLILFVLCKTIFFGSLSLSESQKLIQNLFHFIFYRVIFSLTFIEVKRQKKIWIVWILFLCFLKLFTILGKERLESIRSSPFPSFLSHIKIFSSIILSFLINLICMIKMVHILDVSNFSSFFLYNCESIIILFESVQTLFQYIFFVFEMVIEYSFFQNLLQKYLGLNFMTWIESRKKINLFTNLFFDLLSLLLSLFHHIQILIMTGLHFQMNLIFFSNIKTILHGLWRKISEIKKYKKSTLEIENKFMDASLNDILKFDDSCSICKEAMNSAKKLPCSHLFHSSCLQSWFELNSENFSCPTCRAPLDLNHNNNNNTNSNNNNYNDNTNSDTNSNSNGNDINNNADNYDIGDFYGSDFENGDDYDDDNIDYDHLDDLGDDFDYDHFGHSLFRTNVRPSPSLNRRSGQSSRLGSDLNVQNESGSMRRRVRDGGVIPSNRGDDFRGTSTRRRESGMEWDTSERESERERGRRSGGRGEGNQTLSRREREGEGERGSEERSYGFRNVARNSISRFFRRLRNMNPIPNSNSNSNSNQGNGERTLVLAHNNASSLPAQTHSRTNSQNNNEIEDDVNGNRNDISSSNRFFPFVSEQEWLTVTADQVTEILPHLPKNVIIEDLLKTRSMTATVNRLIESSPW